MVLVLLLCWWLFSAADAVAAAAAAAAAAVVFAHKGFFGRSLRENKIKLFFLRNSHNVCSMNLHTNETINE